MKPDSSKSEDSRKSRLKSIRQSDELLRSRNSSFSPSRVNKKIPDKNSKSKLESQIVLNKNILNETSFSKNKESPNDSDSSDESILHVETNNMLTDNASNKIKEKDNKVWQLFEKIENNLYKCRECEKLVKTSDRSDTNLRSHLFYRHNKHDLLYESQKEQKPIKDVSNKIDTDKKILIDKKLVESIIKDARPFGDFKKRGMLEFLKELSPNYKPLSRQTVAKRLKKNYKEYITNLKLILNQINKIALTSDLWQNRNGTHFLTLTAHFFDLNLEYVSLIISFKRFTGRKLSDKLERFITKELDKLNISDKIVSITTDNGADVKKATSVHFGTRISCFAHNLNLTVKNSLKFWNKVCKDKKRNQEDESEYNDDDTSEDDYQTDTSSDNEENTDKTDTETELSSSDSECSDSSSENDDTQHNLSNKNSTQSSENLIKYYSDLVIRVRKLVKFARKSSIIRSYIKKKALVFAIKDKYLIIDFRVRWNSTYFMINRFLEFKQVITDLIISADSINGLKYKQKEKLRNMNFNNTDWNSLNLIKKELEPFYTATTMLSGRNYHTLSKAYIIQKVLFKYYSTSSNSIDNESILKSIIFEKLKYYFEQKQSKKQTDLTLLAAFLDPEVFKFMHSNDIDKVENDLIKEFPIRSTRAQQTLSKSGTNKSSYTDLDIFVAKYTNYFEENSISDSNKSIKDEISYFTSSLRKIKSVDFAEYWQSNKDNLPLLYSKVLDTCIIPATSIASESAFSVAGFIQRKERCSLKPKTLRYSIISKDFIKLNELRKQFIS